MVFHKTFNCGYFYLESKVWGSWMFSVIVLFLFHWDSTGLAAAKMDVLAFNEQMIPALAMDKVCCSCMRTYMYIEHGHQYGVNRSIDEIRDECYCTLLTMTSCKTDLVLSFILSNSSMQQIPLSLNTKAPLKNGLYSYLQLSSLYTFFSPYHNWIISNPYFACNFNTFSSNTFFGSTTKFRMHVIEKPSCLINELATFKTKRLPVYS